MDPNKKAAIAEACFEEGYNCAQSVLLAFCEETALDQITAARIASPFGGGMGRMREVCGAVSGMFMALGVLDGYHDAKAADDKRAAYDKTRALADRFRAKYGSILCRELLLDAADIGGEPSQRNDAFYKKRPCAQYVAQAARLLAEHLNEREAE